MLKIKKQISKLYTASILGNLSLTGAWGRNSCSTRIQSGRNRNCRNGVSYFQSDV